MGYHHFHLSHEFEEKGHIKRTDTVLLAEVTRSEFTAVGLFDHSVFDECDLETGQMTAERSRLWQLFDARTRRGLLPGDVYTPWLIATSGHSVQHVDLATRYARTVAAFDPRLDDREVLRAHFRRPPHDHLTEKYKLRWHLEYLDLGVHDETSNVFCVAEKGPI